MNREEKGGLLFTRQNRRELLQKSSGLGLSVAVTGALSLREVSAARMAQEDAGEDVRPDGTATGQEAVLNVGGIQEPDTLDPHLTTSESDYTIMNIYDKLISIDRDTGELTGELATDWSTSDDGLRVTLNIREGVKFHDLTDLDADAVKLNFERCIALNSSIAECFENIKAMTVIDPLTLEVELNQPMSSWVGMLALNPKIISPTAISEHTVNDDFAQAWLAENCVGAGAYRHIRWDHGSNLYWEAFPEYWRGWDGKHVTEINYRIILEPGTQRLQLENGDLDIQTIYTQDSIAALKKNPDINVLGSDQPNVLYLRLNNFSGPTSDVRVRKAISYGFDFDTYVSALGIDPPPRRSEMPIPTDLWGPEWMERVPEIPYLTYDPDKARELLAEAGYADGFSMNIYTEDSTQQKVLLAQLYQAFMADIGIDVKIVLQPFTKTLAEATDQEAQKNWDTAIHSWLLYTPAQYPSPVSFLLRMYNPYPNSVRNLLGYENPEVTQLTEQGLSAVDQNEALELFWQANLHIVEDCPDLVLDRAAYWEMIRTWLKGHRQHVLFPGKWYYWELWKQMG